MPANVFVSYDHDHQLQVNGFKAIRNNPNHPLDFHDHSLKEPVLDRTGKPIKNAPSDSRSRPVRDEIKKKFESASRLVVLIGDDTHMSAWVDWEVQTFFKMKTSVSDEDTWKRIRGMTPKGSENAEMPACLNSRSAETMTWDPEALDKWVDREV